MKLVSKFVAKIFNKGKSFVPGKRDFFGKGVSEGKKHHPHPPIGRDHPFDRECDPDDWTY